MDDISNEESTPRGVSRRDFVTRSAILGGMVWAAPAISTLGPRAFADNHAGSPFVAGDCELTVKFKWDWDTNGFESCGTGGDCFPAEYLEEGPTVICVSDNGAIGTTGKFLNASKDDTAGTVTFTITNGGSGYDCVVEAISVKGGQTCKEMDSLDDTSISNGVVVTDDGLKGGSDGPADISHITGVLCCNDL